MKKPLGAVKIVNKYHCASPYIWCGRGSPLGNAAIPQNRTLEERDRVCDWYDNWFNEQMQGNNPASRMVRMLVDRVLKGENLQLGCVCKQPNKEVRCHCDSIKRFIDTQALKERQRAEQKAQAPITLY